MIIPLWPLSIKIDVLIVQIINVLILFWLFNKMFGKTLIEEVEKRKQLTKKLETAEQEYDALMTLAQQEKGALLKEAVEHKKLIVAEAKQTAAQESQKILSAAQRDAQELVAQAKLTMQNEKADLDRHFAEGVKATTMEVVHKLFDTKPELQEAYIAWLVKEATQSK